MNTQNTRPRRLSLPLLALLALGPAACGAAPDQATGGDDPPSSSISISTPSTATPAAEGDGADAGQAGRPTDEPPVDSSNPSPPGTSGAGGNAPGRVRPDQAPREN